MEESDHVLGVQIFPSISHNPSDSVDEDTGAYAKSSSNANDIQNFETTDTVTFHFDMSDLSWEEATPQHSHMLSNSIVADENTEEVICRKDNELFTEKPITECELQEFVCSYKDHDFQSVKDMGVNEGEPSHDKVWIESQHNHDSKDLSDIGPDGDVIAQLSYKEGPRSRPNNDIGKDQVGQSRSVDSMKANGVDPNVLYKLHSANQCKTDLLKVDELEHDLGNISRQGEEDCQKVENTGTEVNEELHIIANLPLQNSEEYEAKPLIEQEVEAKVDSNENQSEEIASIPPGELSATQEPVGNDFNARTNTLPYNNKVESGSIILDFNADSTVSGKKNEEITEMNEEVEKPSEIETMSGDDAGKRVDGETIFSAAMPVPASITYMAPHVHNDIVSQRSESSTGSTRSFAFPVLQAEWNSSPVRMPKADLRQVRKKRGWLHSLICCKF